jgi:hypothetical protein
VGLTVYLGARDEVRGKAAVADLASEEEVRFIRIDVTDEISVQSAAKQIGEDGAWVGQPYLPYSSSKTSCQVELLRRVSKPVLSLN